MTDCPTFTVDTSDLVQCADGGFWTHCAVGNVPSVGGGPTSTPNLFSDSFESGSMAAPTAAVDNANFQWQDMAWSYIVDTATDTLIYRSTGAVNEPTPVNTWESKTGNRNLFLKHSANQEMAEQRFSLDAQNEVWFRYWIRVPDNFSHGSLNNKFFSLWQGNAANYDTFGTITWQTRPSGGGSANLVVQDGGVLGTEDQSVPFIDVATDLGRWMQVVIYAKGATSNGSNDGEMRFYRRWEDENDFTLLQESTTLTRQYRDGGGYSYGYFMGWANDPYVVQTEWMIDDVEVSTSSLVSVEETATKIYGLEFDGNDVVTSAHAGGGSVAFFANNENGTGTGINSTNISVVDITDDPLYPNVKGLRNTYQQDYAAYSFANQTAFFDHPERSKFYMRMRIKWSENWEWGSDQLKFCKNKGQDPLDNGAELSTNFPKFDGDGDLHLTKFAPAYPSINDLYVHAVLKDASNPNYRQEDDINNSFGGVGVDANWSPTNGEWYWIEWEIDAVAAGSTTGSYKAWIDGELYFQLDNVQIADAGDALFSTHQLGHVWQNTGNNNGPTQDIYMEWHSIEIYDKRTDVLPRFQ